MADRLVFAFLPERSGRFFACIIGRNRQDLYAQRIAEMGLDRRDNFVANVPFLSFRFVRGPVRISVSSNHVFGPGSEPIFSESPMVLVVDDDPAVRDVIRKLLEVRGAYVLTAADGHDAMPLFQAHRHRIRTIVLDLVLDHVHGMDFLRQIRDDLPDVRIVFCTAWVGLIQGLVNSGCVDVIEKPFSARTLYEKVLPGCSLS